MKDYNIIMIYNSNMDKILMCKREKSPYKGLINLVGGEIEPDETGFEGAYRELFEETGITDSDVILHHFMDFKYHISKLCLEVYVGRLKKEVDLVTEINELIWSDVDNDYFDMSVYAGQGNIGHIVEQVKEHIFNC